MAKIAISTSSSLQAATGTEITASAVENNTTTAAAAPVLLTLQTTGTINAEGLAQAIQQKAPSLTLPEARFAVNAMQEALVQCVEDADGAISIQLGFATFLMEIAGSLDAADGTPTVANYVYMTGLVPERYRRVFASYDAYVPTGDQPCTLKRIRDKATNDKAIHGAGTFYVEGRNLTYGGTGEKIELWNALGTSKHCDVTVDVHASRIVWECKLPSNVSVPVGSYKLKVTTLAGGPSAGGTLYPLSLDVTVGTAVVPQPSITKVKEGTRADDTVGFTESKVELIGVFPGGMKSGDTVKFESLSGETVRGTADVTEFVTASTETAITLGGGFENTSQLPDDDWNNQPTRVVFTRGGTRYTHNVTFQTL